MTSSTSQTTDTPHFDNAAGCIWHHPEGYIRLEWKRGPVRENVVRELYIAATETMRQFGIKRILSDHRHMPPLSPGLQRWLSDTWVPETIQATGYHRGAVVQAFNLFNRLATNQVVASIREEPLEVAYFDNDHDAARWLLEE